MKSKRNKNGGRADNSFIEDDRYLKVIENLNTRYHRRLAKRKGQDVAISIVEKKCLFDLKPSKILNYKIN